MADLEIPNDVTDLCLARDGEVNRCRPLFTGDVFIGTSVPVLGDEDHVVAILSHPCAMRAGPRIAEHLHVAPVVSYERASERVWEKHFKVLPLGRVARLEHAAIRLDKMTLVAGSAIDSGRRVFCMSRPGINLLRQRLVHHLTRVLVPTHLFDAEAAGAHEELDLMEEWIDQASANDIDPVAASADFHRWITEEESGMARQAMLLDPQCVPSVRRSMRAELGQRYRG